MIGYCGLDCEQCEAFIATRTDDDALRAKVAEEWAKMTHAPIKPEHINCTGCLSAGVKTYFCDQLCEIRKCALNKSFSSCAVCSELPCGALNQILDGNPQARERLEALRRS